MATTTAALQLLLLKGLPVAQEAPKPLVMRVTLNGLITTTSMMTWYTTVRPQNSKPPQETGTLRQIIMRYTQQYQRTPPIKQSIQRSQPTVTAALWSLTPPPLFCFYLLCVRLRVLWWPRESEGERAVHRPHTHSSYTHSLCVSPCMDSRPHLTPRCTRIMCPLYICMHTHAGPLMLSFARHAPLPSCLAAWAEHRNCFCFVFIALSGRPLSLSLCVCVLLYGSNESVCAGRPTLRLFVLFFFYCFIAFLVLWLSAFITLSFELVAWFDGGRLKLSFFIIILFLSC
ncbi:hypothetical protein ECC02_011166 [Trypanosoma cruzi]|uniref:Uncharacterized protein n=1 Tax=Trypanosoma cruzi TaxID=5693 RepID=A0A7J6XPD2_TRYCR|nr:hypothetical protein ECC02_011166 [Trypanosoma cruzi]